MCVLPSSQGLEKLARAGARNGDRMCQQRLDSTNEGLRIVVEPHLMQHASAVVVNAFAGNLSLFVERVKAT